MNGIDHLQQQDHDSLRLFFLLCGSICHFCVNKLTEACFGMAITSQKLLRFCLDSFCLFNTFCYQKKLFPFHSDKSIFGSFLPGKTYSN